MVSERRLLKKEGRAKGECAARWVTLNSAATTTWVRRGWREFGGVATARVGRSCS